MSFTILDRGTATVDAGTLVEVFDDDSTPKKALVSALGVTGPPGAPGTDGDDGTSAPVYNGSGIISGAKVFIGTVSLAADGSFSINVASAGFAAGPVVTMTVLQLNATLLAVPAVVVVGAINSSTTTITGNCYAVKDNAGSVDIVQADMEDVALYLIAIGA